MDWRSGKASRPQDPPFTRPVEDDDGNPADEESAYDIPEGSTIDHAISEQNQYSSTAPSIPPISYSDGFTPVPQPRDDTSPAHRPSMDIYGAFSDPDPAPYSTPNPYFQPEPSRVSRTMQYADPYAAVKASLTSTQQPGPPSYGQDGRY